MMKIVKRLLCLMNGHDNSILMISIHGDAALSCSKCARRKDIWNLKNMKTLKNVKN